MSPFHTLIGAAAFLALVPVTGSTSTANERLHWESLPDIAFVATYQRYCSPAQVVEASAEAATLGDIFDIHNRLLQGQYGGDCRAFYAKEVESRFDMPCEQGLIVVDR
jgi:hypothetical protein